MAPILQRISKTFIKPSSPTPESLRCYNLSSSDQMITSVYISLAFFYGSPGCESSRIRQQLDNSLSRTLVYYYPFAGRLVDNDHIDCNDQGVQFVEVRIHCPISAILKQTTSYAEDLVFPRGTSACHEDSLVVVQLNRFECGGVAIAVCISHKVADGSGAIAFINDWAATARVSSHIPSPLLVADSIFPHLDNSLPVPYNLSKNCVTRRFVFPAAEIEKLKSKAVESGLQQPTRVEVVTALLYQCALLASRSTNSGLSRPSVLIQAVNLRPFLVPPLPRNSVGNIFSINFSIIEVDSLEFPELAGRLRKAKLKFQNLSQEKLYYDSQMQELGECLKQLNTGNFDVYYCSSWCRFPVYDVDFGWGKPTWVCTVKSQIKDMIVLMDSPGDEIAAFVTLEEEKMSAFQHNELLLSFASLYSAK
uniref:Akuammiline synthase 1 n=1 Tax=Alstonia scholaris TaxID=52822 RepID=AKS1_ALSSC|nr:akuammiline synthase [Alstonia scholaris]